jgi:hypothetical protein
MRCPDLDSTERRYTSPGPLKLMEAAGDDRGMTRALLAALLLAIPLITSWILVRRVPHPVRIKDR